MDLNKLIKTHRELLDNKCRTLPVYRTTHKKHTPFSTIKKLDHKFLRLSLTFSIILLLFTLFNFLLISSLTPPESQKSTIVNYSHYLDNLTPYLAGNIDQSLKEIKPWQE